jgi:hypothetical protein
MVKNTLAVFGFLTVLLFSLATVSAAVDNFSLNVVGDGTTSSRLTGSNDSTNSFTISVNNTNTTLAFYVNWTVAATTTMTLPAGANYTNNTNISVSGFSLTMPYKASSYVQLTAHVYNDSDHSTKYGTETVNVYYNNTDYTSSAVTGCMDSSATNYNSSATINGTCTYSTSTYNFCSDGEQGDLEIADVEFTNLGEGEDEDWFLLDEIEIEVEIENTHSTDNIKDVLVEIMIRDSDDNDVTSEFEFSDEEINLNTIKDDDSKFATFTIDELPADLDSGNYKVYIKAYSEDDEDTQCIAEASEKYLDEETYQAIEVTREDDPAVVIKDEDLTKVYASCGDTNVELPLNIYNLGSDKEEKVLVTLINTALEINEQVVIDNLKSGKRKEIVFFFDIPTQLSRDTYTLDIITHYDYDSDEEESDELSYSENSEDDLDKDFSARLEILSCAGAAPRVDASLDSIAEVGTELVIKTLITNNGADNEFAISASDFESWAQLVSITPITASIKEGEFQEITVVLIPTSAGTQSFNIKTIADGETNTQAVSVNIGDEPGFLKGISNKLLFIVAGVSALLISMLIILIMALSRKRQGI